MRFLSPRRYGGFVSEPTPSYTVVSLLHFDDDFTCEAGLIYTIDGTPTIDIAQSKFGVASMNRNIGASGAGNYPYYFDSGIVTDSSTAWTFEFWFYGVTFSGSGGGENNVILQLYDADPTFNSGILAASVNGFTGFLTNDGLTGSVNVSTPEWHHIAMCTLGNTIWYYGDGVLSDTNPQILFPTGLGWCIGGAKNNNGDFQTGYYDEFRVLIGSDPSNCAYPDGTTFTPPSVPFTI